MAKISDNFKKLIDGVEGYEIPDTTPFLCSYALSGLNYEEIIIPESVVMINKNAIPNTIKNVKVIGNNLVSYYGWDANKKYVEIPNGVRELNQQSCYGNPKTIFVPSSVCYIYSGEESDTFNAIPSNVDVMCIDKPFGSLYGSPFRISNPPKKLIWKDEPSLFIKTGENNEVIIDNGDIKELTRGYKGNIGDELNVEIIKYGYVNSISDNITLTDELTIKEYNFENAELKSLYERIIEDSELDNVILEDDNLASIAYGSFRNLLSLKHIDMSKCPKLTTIEDDVFLNCSNLESFILPTSLTYIGWGVFKECSSLKNIDLSYCSKLTNFSSSCFYNCSNLETFILPPSINSINPNCFQNCVKLKTITIPQSTTYIGNNCFGGCNNLTTITINKPQDSIAGAPWGAPNATIVWNG